MIHSTPMRRAFGRLLLGGAALMLPVTGAVADGTNAPAAASAAPKIREQRIVIVERDAAAKGSEAALQTRVIEKDGKTIVIKTNNVISDTELEAKIAKALAAAPNAPTGAPSDGVQRHVIVKRISPDGAAHDMAMVGGEASRVAACAAGAKSNSFESTETGADGEKLKLVMRFCSTGANGANGLEGLKAARDRISKDANLTPAVRDDILKQLDAEIQRLSKQG